MRQISAFRFEIYTSMTSFTFFITMWIFVLVGLYILRSWFFAEEMLGSLSFPSTTIGYEILGLVGRFFACHTWHQINVALENRQVMGKAKSDHQIKLIGFFRCRVPNSSLILPGAYAYFAAIFDKMSALPRKDDSKRFYFTMLRQLAVKIPK